MYETANRSASGEKVADSKRIGLNKLLMEAGLAQNAQKDDIKGLMERNPTFWRQRYDLVMNHCT